MLLLAKAAGQLPEADGAAQLDWKTILRKGYFGGAVPPKKRYVVGVISKLSRAIAPPVLFFRTLHLRVAMESRKSPSPNARSWTSSSEALQQRLLG